MNWDSAPALSGEVFTTHLSYDALNRVVTGTDPGGNITRHSFDIGGMLQSVYLTPSGESESAYVSDIHYNAKGQREAIWYGNGTKTSYTYER